MPQQTFFSVSSEDIERLGDIELTMLLRKLLYLEAASNGIPMREVDAPLQIDVPDGGEDASIRWRAGPGETDWLPTNDVVFQCKATRKGPTATGNEVLHADGTGVKPRVDDVLLRGGAYVLFYYKGLTGDAKADRVDAIREAFRSVDAPYADSALLRVYDANRIAEWTNTFPSAPIQVLRQRSHSPHLKTWNQWKESPGLDNRYFSTDEIAAYFETVRSTLSETSSVVRIEGPSGLGKTRFALEALRPPDNPEANPAQMALSESVVYLDTRERDGIERIALDAVTESASDGKRAVFVVDNCDSRLHRQLVGEVKRQDSRISLLTLDYELNQHLAEQRIELSPDDLKGVVRDIIEETCPGIANDVVDRAAEFSEGFPQIAVLLGQSWQSDRERGGALNDNELVERLLFGRSDPDPEVEAVARLCSLFTSFGVSDEVSGHLEFIAHRAGVEPEDVYGTCVDLESRGIFEFAGRYARVTPLPLALRLASDWWTRKRPEDVAAFIEETRDAGLVEPFCRQMEKLYYLSHSQEIVDELCGTTGPFGRADILDTEWGSRLLRSFASINPEAVARAMQRAFGRMSIEDLRQVAAGRRNLVWTLERLAFWKETFPTAARLLLRFGAAENERWANNASGQFRQLFQIFLPGTEASLESRQQVLREGVHSEEVSEQRLAILGLNSALKAQHFSRTGGVEEQGGRIPKQDYQPTNQEIIDYWRGCMGLLADLACEKTMVDLVKKEFGERIGGLIAQGAYEEVVEAANRIISCTNQLWLEAISSTQWAINYGLKEAPPDIRSDVSEFYQSLLPDDIPGRIALWITNSGRFSIGKDHRDQTEFKNSRVQELAEDIFAREAEWEVLLQPAMQGRQSNGFLFGKTLARQASNATERGKLLDAAIDVLADLPNEERDASVVAGVASAMPEGDKNAIKNRLRQRDDLIPYYIQILRNVEVDAGDLEAILRYARSGRIHPDTLAPLRWSGFPEELDLASVAKFAEELSGLSGFEPIAFELFGTWSEAHTSDDLPQQVRSTLLEMFAHEGLLSGFISQTKRDIHLWGMIAERLIPHTQRHHVEQLVESILNQYRVEDVRQSVPSEVTDVLGSVLVAHPEVAWPPIGQAMLEDSLVSFRLSISAGMSTMIGGEDGGGHLITSSVPNDILKEWMREEGLEAVAVVARIARAFEPGNPPKWDPLVKWIIDEFGDQEEVLGEISANVGSFGSVGSRAPYYLRRVVLMKQLGDHHKHSVRAWAASEADYLEERLRQARLEDEEREFRL